jgi:Type II secretion system (T2SS), protein M subtype b
MSLRKAALQKIAALALLLLALSPLLFIFQTALIAYRANAEEIVARGELYDRLRAIANFHKSATINPADQNDLAAVLFGDGTPAVLSAGLQAKLRELAAGLGVEIIQVSELQAKTRANLQQIGVRVEMSGQLQGTHQLLQQIGSNKPWLFIENLQLRSGIDQGLGADIEPPLYLALDIWGLAPIAKLENTTP